MLLIQPAAASWSTSSRDPTMCSRGWRERGGGGERRGEGEDRDFLSSYCKGIQLLS